MPRENDDKSFFGGRDKSRGIKHQKDKSKYKPKSVKDPKHVPPKTKRNLGSNWDRYEAEDDVQDFQLTSSTDFSILANVPIAQGQHFQFKQDKIIAEEIEKTPQDLFSLDLNMLKHSILTVPFYKRVGIDERFFTKNQISFMNASAENGIIRYNEKYNSNKESNECIQEPSLSTDVRLKNQIENIDVPDSIASNTDEVNEGVSQLATKIGDMMKSEKGQEPEKSGDDLEQWLDDILDD